MKRWKEPVKTILLDLLVLASFVLTSMLWNNQPQFEVIAPATYVESKLTGQSRQLDDLVTPESIIFHYGGARHTKANTNDSQYRLLRAEMAKWYFYDFTAYPMPKEKWQALTHDKPGLEIRYGSTVPIPVISQLFTFRGEMDEKIKGIDRIWLYYEESEDIVYALFISGKDQQVIRAKTVVTPKDLRESYLPLGRYLPEEILKVVEREPENSNSQARAFWDNFYLPKDTLKMRKYRYNFLPITDRDLIETFFLDPTLIRQIVERDGTVIYTDGSRSVQIRPERKSMIFTDPALPQRHEPLTNEDTLLAAITFVNKHIGWTDTYRFEQIEKREGEGDQVSFRQYIGAYPLVSEDGQNTDQIALTLEQGQVVTMKRSMIDLDAYIDYQEWSVMSGPELYQKLRQRKVDVKLVKNAYLGYQSRVMRGFVELTPVWVVEKITGEMLVLDAKSTEPKGGRGSGLE